MPINLNVDLKQRQELGLNLTPELVQSIELLQFTSLELANYVQQELEKNPVLEMETKKNEEENEKESENETDELKKEEEKWDDDWEEYFDDGRDMGYYKSYTSSGEEKDSFETFTPEKISLFQHLQRQFQLVSTTDSEYKLGLYILSSVNEQGYLQVSVEDIADYFKSSLDEVNRIRKIIMNLEPIGVGSMNLKEFLLLQLDHLESSNRWLRKMIEDYFTLVQAKKVAELSKKLRITNIMVQKCINKIGELIPFPTFSYNDSDSNQFIKPDVLFKKVGNEWYIIINDEYLPYLRLNRSYVGLLTSNNISKKDKNFLKENINSAENLIKAINQRHMTMYRVSEKILEKQYEFFEKGPAYMKPMILKDIADDLKLSESTISRCTRGKYGQTPYGIFELKYFFSNGLPNLLGDSVSSTVIKEKIKNLIQNEDIENPLSDTDLWKKFLRDGLKVERKTISNYRDDLGILPKHLRRTIKTD
jgi:RNA polymerase sigma-54 factor